MALAAAIEEQMNQADLTLAITLALVAILPIACLALLDRALPTFRRLRRRLGGLSHAGQASRQAGHARTLALPVGRRVVLAGLGLFATAIGGRALIQELSGRRRSSSAAAAPPTPVIATMEPGEAPSPPEGWGLVIHEGAYLMSDGRYVVAELV